MRARVTIEYDIPRWDEAKLGPQGLREREEPRWITSETLLALPGSATVKVELVDKAEAIGGNLALRSSSDMPP
jgi:hypothetical protein